MTTLAQRTILTLIILLGAFFVTSLPAKAQDVNPCGDPLLVQVGPGGSCRPIDENIRASGVPIIGQDNVDTSQSPAITLFNRILNGIIAIITAIAVLVIIISGVRFATSGGDPQTTQQARTAIISALIALVIVIFTRSIVSFVLTRV